MSWAHMFVQGSHMFAMFYAHTLCEKWGISVMHTHITLTTFTRFAQKSIVGTMLALYGSTMHLATVKPYLHACSYTIWPYWAMEVIWRIFLLSVSAPLKLHTE